MAGSIRDPTRRDFSSRFGVSRLQHNACVRTFAAGKTEVIRTFVCSLLQIIESEKSY